MLQPRSYQRAAIDKLRAYWENGGGNGLIVLPTGAGKALVIALLCKELLEEFPELRIINVTHSKTLVEQNYMEFIGLWPSAPAGIYSAGLGRRDRRAQVLFCGIQSVASKVDSLGPVDLVLVDEAHAISRNANTQYGQFFSALREANEDMRICGLTATDYRMDSGRLTDALDDDGAIDAETGEPVRFRLFDDVVYEIGIGELMKQGFLTHLTSQKTLAKIDLKGVGTRGGDYIPGQMSEAAERIIEEAVAEDMVSSAGRRAALFFCASKDNAEHAAEAVRRRGKTCAALTSSTPKDEAARIIRDFRAGDLWAISSVNMITTGANFPFVDFISLLFATKSAGKLVQVLGRGTRNYPGKVDCLVADHGKNLAYHGPIDQIQPRDPTSRNGEQPKKLCPTDETDIEGKSGCGELLPISLMKCPCCDYIFPPSPEEKITAQADTTPVLSTEMPWLPVSGQTFNFHEKVGGLPSVRIEYRVGMKVHKTWVCPQHTGFAKSKADRWWAQHGGQRPFPASVDEFLDRASELLATAEVKLKFGGKYAEIIDFKPAERVEGANDNAAVVRRREPAAPRFSLELDDDIPF